MCTPANTTSSAPQLTTSAPTRATVSKTFHRSVYLAEVVGGRLCPSRMVVVRFLECEATLQGIIRKVQEAIGNHDPVVLTDAQGNAIFESEGTTGSQYWKQTARKILAVQEQDIQELQDKKRRRTSRKDEDAAGIGDVTEKVEELVLGSTELTRCHCSNQRAHQSGYHSKSHPDSIPATGHQARVLLCYLYEVHR